jgi:hypothetical protein
MFSYCAGHNHLLPEIIHVNEILNKNLVNQELMFDKKKRMKVLGVGCTGETSASCAVVFIPISAKSSGPLLQVYIQQLHLNKSEVITCQYL